jgi:adenylate cyclase
MTAPDVSAVFEWLVDGAPGASTPAAVVARLGPELREAGLPLDRVEAFVRTLHPHIVGRTFLWTPQGGVKVAESSYAYLTSPAFLESPVAEVFRTGAPVRRRLEGGDGAHGYPALDELARAGFTDFYAGPLRFMSGESHAITFATRRPGGFADAELDAVARVLRPLSRVAEVFALSRTAANLLDAYVGHDAGARILAGRIQRGDTDTLEAVIWFSDLRGFTAMSSTMPPNEIIRVLNELFDCQVPAIERHGGEVLKFMGDGLLAILPLPPGDRSVERAAAAALEAAREAFAALEQRNAARAAASQAPLRFGLALHVGEVAYGNIGGSGRLDFTCIGPAVNLAARLEALTSKLGRPLVVSAALADKSGIAMESLGTFELKGVAEPAEVFAPR